MPQSEVKQCYVGTAGVMFDFGSARISSWLRCVFSLVAVLLVAIVC